MIKAVIFDLDNTLFDFMAMKRQAINAAMRAMIDAGFNLDYEQMESRIKYIYDEKGIEYQKVFDELILEQLGYLDHKILSAGIIAYRRAREAALIPYPHATATLTALVKSQIKLGVLSDAPSREAWLRLCYMNYHHFFDCVVTHDDSGERKPSPKPFKIILEKLGVNADEAIMVGDWFERDMIGAKNVGIFTAYAKYGAVKPLDNTEADYTLKSISNLIEIINKLNNK